MAMRLHINRDAEGHSSRRLFLLEKNPANRMKQAGYIGEATKAGVSSLPNPNGNRRARQEKARMEKRNER